MAQANKAPEKTKEPVAPLPEVAVEHAVKKEVSAVKPAPRNVMKPAKAKDVVQGVARERR